MSFQRIRTFDKLAKPFVNIVGKYYPDAFIFVIVLSIVTYFLAVTIAGASHVETLIAWGEGLPKLFTFTAQITLIMIGAHALAHTKPIENILIKVGSIANKPWQAYALVTFFSGCASLIAWSLGLIVGGILSKFVGLGCIKKKSKSALSFTGCISLFRLCNLAHGLFIIMCIICINTRSFIRK